MNILASHLTKTHFELLTNKDEVVYLALDVVWMCKVHFYIQFVVKDFHIENVIEIEPEWMS